MTTYVCVSCPDGTRESRVYQDSELHFYIDALLPQFYALNDTAYTLSENLVIKLLF